jgi:hypothetical protein
MRRKCCAWVRACLHGEPRALRRLYAIETLFWGAAIVPTLLFWADSILWVGLMSCWANLSAAKAAWQSSRVEVKQDEA